MNNRSASIAVAISVDHPLVKPVSTSGGGFYVTAFALLIVMGWAFIAWLTQYIRGLGVSGLDRPVYWGVYITNFVFFVGISHAGTLISAILRVTGSEWRRPITRAAEAITVFALMVGPINVFFDLGRPDRVLNMFLHGQLKSPLMWDVICISTYLVSSLVYLYLPLIPDIAELRDTGIRPRWFYRLLSLNWRGTEKQKHILEKMIRVMAIAIIPIAVSVHTVVSWVFAMTIQPMWHSTIFGPYFVVGAIFSGIASIIIAMAILRKVYHLEDYLKPIHFNNLGILLLVMTCLWVYFTFAEYLTTFYGGEPAHMAVFYSKLTGEFAPMFWSMGILCFIIPFVILAVGRFRTITGTVIASISVNIGMWLERYTIVVPSLSNPRLPISEITYYPSWVEISITAGCFAGLTFFYVMFSKIFPIISIWELKEGGVDVAAGEVISSAATSGKKRMQ
ncbi:MAG: hypothetical protein A2W25_06225 [candidate division Zixibacteria bacterium RBG_16_53_22]|nr:MAG: hypothetical protein A2W25_06225 [candidate division Zixibacteria bacterium RBG_16_53_22]